MRRVQQQQPAPQPAVEEGAIPHSVSLQAATPIDGLLQGVTVKGASLLAWHPTRQRLLTASTAALVEYDAVSGARRHLVEPVGTPLHVCYAPNGSSVLLLTRERGIYSWAAGSWKRRILLAPDRKYAGKNLAAALMAVSGGQHPTVYWTPLGKNTVRMVHSAPLDVPKGAKLEREQVPGVKLKTENKKPIVGLAAHPTERGILFVLLADGTLQVCGVSGPAIATLFALPMPGINATAERVALHAWPHPILPGGALLAVEAATSGVSILEALPRQEPRLLGTLSFGPGSAICGVGLLSNGLLCAAGRLSSGNVQVQAWELVGDSRELQVLPTVVATSMVWDALQGLVGKAALADVTGENVITRLHFHAPSGAIAIATGLRGREAEAGHYRVPLLHLVDGQDVAGVPPRSAIHSGLGFWTARDGDSMVSKLRFPRYAHVISAGRLTAYDLTHGQLSDYLVLPPTNAAGQERSLMAAVHSPKQAAWLAFTQILSRQREGTMGPGQREFTLVRDSEAALTTGQWMLPGADGAFAGGNDDLAVILSNSGRTVAVYETAKLSSTAAKPLYSAELKEGLIAAVFPGPPAHIPPPPTPPPASISPDRDLADSDDSDAGEDDAAAEERREWEAGERRRLELPRLVLLRTQSNQLCLAEVSPSSASYSGKSRVLPVRASLVLRPGEAVVQLAWQSLMPAGGAASFHSGCDGAATASAAAAAVLTSQRLLIVNERLRVLASAGIPSDMGLPASCLWMGPALLVSTTTGQVLQVCWDGKPVHLCSLLNTAAAPALLGALADRLLITSRATAAGRAEVSGRGISVLQPLLLGWASLASRNMVPGGTARVRQELHALVASYDASQLGAVVLERLAAAGFADVAAAVAARSDSPAITPAHKAVFQAAAGDWQPLLLLVMLEWEQSTFHPGPPPRNSQLYSKMVALAHSCQQYGRFADARRLLEAVGAYGELLALCVFQGDFQGLQDVARKAGRDVEQLADQLMAVNENVFMHGSSNGSLYGGRPNTDDWTITTGEAGSGGSGARAAPGVGGEDGAGSDAGSAHLEIEVAPAGRLPFQEASLQVLSAAEPVAPSTPATGGEEEGQPIEGLDLGTLEAFVGVAGATVIKPAVSTPTAAAAGAAAAMLGTAAAGATGGSGALARMETGLSDISAAAHPLGPQGGGRGAAGGYESDGEGAAARDETAAQAAARAAFRRDTADDDDDFFSSDEESAPTEGDSRSVASMATGTSATATSSRFRIAIKPADEAATQRTTDASALRAAAQSLRLGGLGSLSGGSADSTPFSTSRSAGGSLMARSASGAGPKLGGLAPPPGSGTSPSKASSISGDQPAAPAVAVPPGDPFADLFGLGTPASSSSSVQPAAAPTPAAASAASSGPMRPQPPAPAQSNLLAGWDDFEALFSAAPKPPAAATAAPRQQLGGEDPFGPVMFPPPPPSAAPAPAPTASPAKTAAAQPAAAAGPGGNAKQARSVADLAPASAKKEAAEGVAAFAAGRWDAAATQLGKALDKAGKKADTAFVQQALQLFVAARLLAAKSSKSAAAAARLARFAAALPLGEAQKLAAVAAAVELNMAAKNYGYAADQLTFLVIESTSGAAGLDAMDLQDKLNTCDRAGSSNAAVPRDEDRESFAAIVASCTQRSEAEELVENIVNA